MMKKLSILMLISIFTLGGIAKAADKKNILFISIDDLKDWTGVLGGHPQATTPAIDELASMGMTFTNCQTPSPLCGPCRAALLTGISTASNGIYSNGNEANNIREGSIALKDRETIFQYFRKNGYTTIGSGKLFHSHHYEEHVLGFDEFYPSFDTNSPDTWKHKPSDDAFTTKDDFKFTKVGGAKVIFNDPDGKMSDTKIAEWVASKLQEDYDKPLFMAFGFYRPHLPFKVPQKYFDMFPLDDIILPEVPADFNDMDDIPAVGIQLADTMEHYEIEQSTNGWKKAVQGYLASTTFTDAQLQIVLDALKTSGKLDNTIIVLWTDHGWNLGEKKHWRKHALWEETTNTVLSIVVPDVTNPGSFCHQPVSLLDLYPTLLELTGLEADETLQGKSIASSLTDSAKVLPPVVSTYLEGNHSVMGIGYHYIRYHDGGEELYDLNADPNEWYNKASDLSLASIKDSLRSYTDLFYERESERRKLESVHSGYEIPFDMPIWIRSVKAQTSNKYFNVNESNTLHSISQYPSEESHIFMIRGTEGSDTVQIETWNGSYWKYDKNMPDNPLTTSTQEGDDTKFIIEFSSEIAFSLRPIRLSGSFVQYDYLSADHHVDINGISGSETTMKWDKVGEIRNDVNFVLKSKLTGEYLTMNDESGANMPFATASDFSTNESKFVLKDAGLDDGSVHIRASDKLNFKYFKDASTHPTTYDRPIETNDGTGSLTRFFVNYTENKGEVYFTSRTFSGQYLRVDADDGNTLDILGTQVNDAALFEWHFPVYNEQTSTSQLHEEGDGFFVYPNPARNALNVVCVGHDEKMLNLKVYDAFGKEYASYIRQGESEYVPLAISIDSLPIGTYILSINDGLDALGSRKFVKY